MKKKKKERNNHNPSSIVRYDDHDSLSQHQSFIHPMIHSSICNISNSLTKVHKQGRMICIGHYSYVRDGMHTRLWEPYIVSRYIVDTHVLVPNLARHACSLALGVIFFLVKHDWVDALRLSHERDSRLVPEQTKQASKRKKAHPHTPTNKK